eukprot:CAMPEP_0170753026 /NCGR_PEP_ID=MMETSP0437-20130122/12273_1 /TAXON_ID=0 /ORGANISM="Sexangularia sp." /LENGTH=336 /DNA_ID=CAMNT_0011092117 /DNA_START=170 /DNA_END=1180 /DNA_ORIENTATION=+
MATTWFAPLAATSFWVGHPVAAHVVAFVAVELGYYWLHRLSHTTSFGWAAHAQHHSSHHYNLSTALRQGALQYLFGWLFFGPIGLLGLPLDVLNAQLHLNRIFQFWLHTQTVDRLWWPIEFIFNTPSHHRVHHSNQEPYLDTNYGGTLIIFDRLFGTFVPEEQEVRYGLTSQVTSFDPVALTICAYTDIAVAAKAAGRSLLWAAWASPSDLGNAVPADKQAPTNYVAVQDACVGLHGYRVLSFALAVVSLRTFEAFWGAHALSSAHLAFLAMLVIASVQSVGQVATLDQRQLPLWRLAQGARLALSAALFLSIFPQHASTILAGHGVVVACLIANV